MTVGRPRLRVWCHFEVFEESKDAQCSRCGEMIVNAKVEKLERHILKRCDKWSSRERRDYVEAAAREPQRKKHRTSIDSTTSSDDSADGRLDQDEFNKIICDHIINTGAPFRVVEEETFHDATLKGRDAGLKMPSRKLVSGRLLTEAFEEERAKLVETLRGLPYVAVTADGATSVSHQKKVNAVLTAPNMKPKLWKSAATGADSQTGKYIANFLLEVADEVDDAVGRNGFVTGAVTDNAKAMISAWAILESKGLICAGCGAHTMNLLLQDIAKLNLVKEVVTKAPRVSRYFRDRKLLLARFDAEREVVAKRREDKGFNKTLSLPVITRWYSVYNCLVSVIKNREAIVGVFQDSDFMAQYRPKPKRLSQGSSKRAPRKQKRKTEFEEVEAIIQDDMFWSLGKKVMKLLAPIIKKLGVLETDGCSAGMVYWTFVDLLKQPIYCRPPFLADTASSILECIKARWEFLHTDTMAVAFLLDPTKDPSDFVDNDRDKALDHVRDVSARLGYSQQQQEDAYHEATVFLNRKWDWGHEERLRQGRKAPLEWWGCEREAYPNLFEIARRIFTIPTSSAAAERSWSIHSYIHSKLRNRLTAKNVQKLAFVYSNRMKSEGFPPVLFNQSVFEDCDEEYSSEDDAWADEDTGPFLGCDAEQSSDDEDEDDEAVEEDTDVSVDNCYDHVDEDEYSEG